MGLLARKWGNFSRRSDCVLTYPVFLTPHTPSVDLSPRIRAARGVSHACWEQLGLSHSRDVGAGGREPRAVLSWKQGRRGGERGVPGWWQAGLLNGDNAPTPTPPRCGAPTPAVKTPWFLGSGRNVAAPGSPGHRSAAALPHPRPGDVSPRGVSGCKVSARQASVLWSFQADRTGDQL